MNIFTKALSGLFVVVFTCCGLSRKASAQNVGSVSLGSAGDTARWDTVLVGESPVSTNVTIMAGDTVSLDSSVTCAELLVQKGAILNSIVNAANGDTYWLQPGLRQGLAFNITKDTIDNEGVFGSAAGTNDGITLAMPGFMTYLRLTGGGKTAIGAMMPSTGNQNLVFELNQDATLNQNGMAFTALPPTADNSINNRIIFDIDTGKTLALINPHGHWQGDPGVLSGNYQYNIYGTLDLAATRDTQMMVPDYSSAISQPSATVVDVIGKLELGPGFDSSKGNIANSGAIGFNIYDGGVVDASRTTALNMGITYFATAGTGVLIRRVDNTGEVFPVGAAGSSTGNPITLSNKGTATNFSVSVKNQFDFSVPNSNTIVNKQWTVTADSIATADVTITPQWLTADQAAGFDPKKSLSIIRYNGTDWVPSNASLSGLGTVANPYAATAGGFSSFGQFAVENSQVNTQGVSKMTVYPNPVASDFTVLFPAATTNGTISITNVTGEKMLSNPVVSGQSSWGNNISGWAPGVYIITLQHGGKNTSVKLIKL